MKTYGYHLILHIVGLVLCITAGVLAIQYELLFCSIICGLLLVGICYHLYRIQMRQTETMYNPQNEMFRLLGTKRSFSQNETFFFSHPYPALFRLISHF